MALFSVFKRACAAVTIALVTALASTTAVLVGAQPAAAAGPADHVLYWNDVLLRTYRQVGGAPTTLTRSGAIMHTAIYDAANSVMCSRAAVQCLGQSYVVKLAQGGDLATAMDYAAYRTLAALYPAISFDADLATAQSDIPASPDRDTGASTGTQVAQAVLQARANDGSGDTTPYVPGTVPGAWRPTGSGAAATPNWGKLKPFALTGSTQFRPPLPGGFTSYPTLLASSQYAAQVNEVKRLGSATSTDRTADQTQIAWFWANDLDGTYKPPGQHFAHTQIVAKQRGLSTLANAKLFAQVALALADAAITAWDAKYDTDIDLWRPETAVQLADTDNNAATTADPNWRPLSADRNGVNFSPPFPAYISGHATLAGAWATVMRNWFGTDNITFTATTEDPHAVGVTRTFTSFSAAAVEDARSRIYLGVHYQWDADFGNSSGTSVANHVSANYLGPNTSSAEVVFYSTQDASGSTECSNLGSQLVAEHRWTSYRCQWTEKWLSYDLFVR
jgi:hypothetical protein